MRRQVDISAECVSPSEQAVARALGIPASADPDERTLRLIGEAVTAFADLAKPVGLSMPIDRETFDRVYRGEGSNQPDTPLDVIAPEADRLALYAVTVGDAVSLEISRLFDKHDFAVATALDAAASEGAELAAVEVERQYAEDFATDVTMAFSPGYCGWHVSAQKELFEVLKPESIGIALTPSCLMEPLKSVSGVILAGAKEIFEFEDSFPFCDACVDRNCRGRIAALRNEQNRSNIKGSPDGCAATVIRTSSKGRSRKGRGADRRRFRPGT